MNYSRTSSQKLWISTQYISIINFVRPQHVLYSERNSRRIRNDRSVYIGPFPTCGPWHDVTPDRRCGSHLRSSSLARSKVTPIQTCDSITRYIRGTVSSDAMRYTTDLRDEVSTDVWPPSVKFQWHAQYFFLLTSTQVCIWLRQTMSGLHFSRALPHRSDKISEHRIRPNVRWVFAIYRWKSGRWNSEVAEHLFVTNVFMTD